MDAALSLHPRVAHAPAIEHIVVELGTLQARMLRAELPSLAHEARFSAPFAIACALTHGRLGLSDLQAQTVAEPGLQALMRRVEVRELDQPDPDEPLFAVADRVEVRLGTGEVLRSEPVTRAKGHARRPLDDADLRHKFLDCAGRTMGSRQTQALWRELSQDDRPATHAHTAGRSTEVPR